MEIISGLDKKTCLRVLALCTSSISCLFWGSINVGTYYTNALKDQYNLTQNQAEMLFPILNAGKVFGPLPAFVLQTYGPIPTFVLAISFTSLGCFLASTTQYYVHFCHEYPVIIYVFFFMMGIGTVFFHLATLSVTTSNFPARSRGKAVALLMNCVSLSRLLNLFVYRRLFADGVIENDASQDISGFLQFCAVSTGATGLLSIALVRRYEKSDPEHLPLTTQNEEKSAEASLNEGKHLEQTRSEWCNTFCSWPLQMVIWSFVLFYSIYFGFDLNVAVYAKSAEVYNIFDRCFALLHICSFITRIAVGFMSDTFLGVVPHMFYLAASGSLLVVCLLVAVFFPTAEATLYAMSVVAGCTGGAYRITIITVLTKEYGQHNFAKYLGIMYSLSALGLTAWLAVFSSLYQSAITEPDEVDCFGSSCLKWINLTSAILIAVPTTFGFILAVVKKF